MALERLKNDEVYRWHIASPLAFADIENPTLDELNANASNDPDGLIFNLSCALDTDNSQFDLDDPDLDESLTFCQRAGDSEVLSRSATVAFGANMSKARWDDATSTDSADGYNTATLAQSLLTWRGVEYLAVLSVGKAYDQPYTAGDQLKIVSVSTDHAIPAIGSGENQILVQTFASRGDIAWNVSAVA